ncbi:MAG: hypothetical protein ACJ8R9_05640 [Steroidobacteraceae bacterium]
MKTNSVSFWRPFVGTSTRTVAGATAGGSLTTPCVCLARTDCAKRVANVCCVGPAAQGFDRPSFDSWLDVALQSDASLRT